MTAEPSAEPPAEEPSAEEWVATSDQVPVPVPQRIADLAVERPNDPALTFGDRTLSWDELHRTTNRWARALAAEGVRLGDYVTVVLPNSIAHVLAFVACWKVGAIPQPVSSRLPPAELQQIVELAAPSLVLASEDTRPVPGCPWATVDTLDPDRYDDGPLPVVVSPSWKAPTSGGSTGRPKLIVSGHPALVTGLDARFWRIRPDSTMVMPGPMYHNGPISSAYAGFFTGAHLVLAERFDPEGTLELVERHGATWLYLVPTMMHRIWRLPEQVRLRYDVSSLQVVWHLAAPCPDWLKRAWMDWLGPEAVWELYGGTEGTVTTRIRGDEWLDRPGSVGRPIAGELRILGLDGEALPAGEVGEVYMRGPEGAAPTYRYIGATPRTRDGWESIGDLGWLDADGFLYLADRRTDLILVGGANVYPAEVEAAIDEHPLVASSAVIGLPDDDLGRVVHAVVQPRDGLDVDDLRRHLEQRLVRYKLPRTIELVDEPLRDDAGKVRRSALLAERVPS